MSILNYQSDNHKSKYSMNGPENLELIRKDMLKWVHETFKPSAVDYVYDSSLSELDGCKYTSEDIVAFALVHSRAILTDCHGTQKTVKILRKNTMPGVELKLSMANCTKAHSDEDLLELYMKFIELMIDGQMQISDKMRNKLSSEFDSLMTQYTDIKNGVPYEITNEVEELDTKSIISELYDELPQSVKKVREYRASTKYYAR